MSPTTRVLPRPQTQAVQRAIGGRKDAADDLLFLEAWRMQRAPLLGATLRAGQIRRANPHLTEEIDAELRPVYSRRTGNVAAAATMVTEKQAIVRNTPRKA